MEKERRAECLKLFAIRVQNFRNVDDSGWNFLLNASPFLWVATNLVKRPCSKALHKFNPATPEPYNPQREFPRDHYTREFKNGTDWPVCSVAFELEAVA